MNIEKDSFISHYKMISPLGAGGMGEVWIAEDTKLNRKVAIKFLKHQFSQDTEKLKRFIQEAKVVSALNHPNILTIHEIGEVNGQNYIVTELIEGKTLRQFISAKEPIRIDAVIKIGIQMAEALASAHSVGIIHRDIKPENIMLRADGYAKLLDFGLAKLSQTQDAHKFFPHDATIFSIKTVPGMILGSFPYMSPEQARGQQVDARSDIFSLGVVLYELLTRRQPFRGETFSHIIISILEQEPPPISTTAEFPIPAKLEKIIQRMLAKNVENRYQNIKDLISDFETLKQQLNFEAELARQSQTVMFNPVVTGKITTDNTIAVLPFLNMSRSKNGDYFSDGLAEELLNVLSKIRGLRVAARTSAFSFKGKSATVGEIGKALNVASVLEGSVRIAGNRVRVAVQLVDVADGYHLWAESYNRTMDDIFAIQDDIAQSVVQELRARLIGESDGAGSNRQVISEVAQATRGRADDPEAQRLMLLGRYFLDRTTRADTDKAISYFRQALDIDPEYARCWAELGRAYSIEAGRAWVNVEEGFDRSSEATKRALELEPQLAEGYAQLGRIQLTHDWDFRAAEISFQRALDLAPDNSSVLDGASLLEYKTGRFEKALTFSRRVSVQDPLSAAFWHNLGLTCHAAGLLLESETAFRRALEIVPQRFVTNALLALVLMDQGLAEEALEQAAAEPDEFWRLWSLAIIYHLTNRKADAKETLQKLLDEYADGNAYQIAEIYSIRGEKKEAFKWLNRALKERDPGITHTKVNPRFHPLHTDPQWTKMLKKIGF